MTYEAAIFDLDGTLVDSTHAHAGAWQKAFDRFGLHSPVQKYYRDIGMGSRDIINKHMPGVDDSTVNQVLALQRDLFMEDFLPHVRPYPSASELLTSLNARNVGISLASSSPRELIRRLVGLLNAPGAILGWVGGDEVRNGKPAPDIFLAGSRICGVPPHRAIVVGDSPYDVQAAHRAGISCIALLQSGFSRSSLKDADHLFADVNDLLCHAPRIWGLPHSRPSV